MSSTQNSPKLEASDYAEDFLKRHTLSDIDAKVTGELLEYSTELASYFYGNGELIVSPSDETEESFSFFVDTYGSKKVLCL